MKISGIYKIQSKIKPERYYIGSSVKINTRWSAHLNSLRKNKHTSPMLQHHFNKYGESDLQFFILLGCEKEDLIKTEQYFLDSHKPWFNTNLMANSPLGLKRTEEAKAKMRKPKSLEARKKMSDYRKGRKVSLETRKNMSIAFKGRKYAKPRPKEVYERMANTRRGQKMSPEFCKHDSEMRKGIKMGENYQRDILNRIKNKE